MLRTVTIAVAALAVPVLAGAGASDDATFRPTVLVRQGNAAGSGAVIASVPGETLVLTAAHVVADAGKAPVVEVHRYNLGMERTRAPEGWPVRLDAEVIAEDPSADVAVLRIKGKAAMPFVARLGRTDDAPKRGAVVTSVGIDGGERLACWSARVAETAWFVMKPVSADGRESGLKVAGGPKADDGRMLSGASGPVGLDRPFLLTTRAPIEGRSGGGLFDESGAIVGVCVGRLEAGRDRGRGVFSSGESVRALLRLHDLEAALARSDAFQGAARKGAAAQSVVKPLIEHHNKERASDTPAVPPRADRARGGPPALGRE